MSRKRMEEWKNGRMGGAVPSFHSSILPSQAFRLLGLLLLFLVGMNFISCKSKKHLTKTDSSLNNISFTDTLDEKCHLDHKNGKALTRLMKEKELDFKTAVGKFSCDLTMGDEEHSVNVSVRCRKDSVIWLNMSKVGLDILRALITKDSVKFMIMVGDNKGYFKGDYSFINDTLNADLDYEMLQALLFGNSADFLMDSVKLKGGKDRKNCQYFLSTIRKRRLKKLMQGAIPKESVQTIWLKPETFKIAMTEFDDAEMKRKFNACYDDFQPVDNFTMPFKMLYTITAEKTIKADIKYGRMKLNEETSFPFRIPDSYEPIKLKKNTNNNPVDEQQELQMRYDLAMQRGNDAMTVKSWDVAAAAFSEALTYKKDDALALKKKKEAEDKLKDDGKH